MGTKIALRLSTYTDIVEASFAETMQIYINSYKLIRSLSERLCKSMHERRKPDYLEELEMTIEKFCENFPGKDNSSAVVRKLVSELMPDENKEEILTFWCDEGDATDDRDSKLQCYIVTDKRLFEVYVDSNSFGYKSYFLKYLSSFKEKVISERKDSHGIKCSSYFSDGNDVVESYTVKFSFSVTENEANEVIFFFTATGSWKDKRFKELRDFVRGFYSAIDGL